MSLFSRRPSTPTPNAADAVAHNLACQLSQLVARATTALEEGRTANLVSYPDAAAQTVMQQGLHGAYLATLSTLVNGDLVPNEQLATNQSVTGTLVAAGMRLEEQLPDREDWMHQPLLMWLMVQADADRAVRDDSGALVPASAPLLYAVLRRLALLSQVLDAAATPTLEVLTASMLVGQTRRSVGEALNGYRLVHANGRSVVIAL